MNTLLGFWDAIAPTWAGKNIILFFDYDGTLAPIAADPSLAVLSDENKDLLRSLLKVTRCHITVISGRALDDVKTMVGISGINYIGNHGLEIEGSYICFESLVSEQTMITFSQIKKRLTDQLQSVPGAFVEDKGLTLSVHYRQASPQEVPFIQKIVEQVCDPLVREEKIKKRLGKKVFEIKPPIEWDKGKAALWVLKRQQMRTGVDSVVPIYIGDDATDEDAFAALKDKGVTVCVGNERLSHAQYFLSGPEDVTAFLRRLLEDVSKT